MIVVEGYLDVIALDQAGFGEAVAPLGTALTEAQMARLWSLVDDPILCFDGDAAGRKASLRAAARALPVLRPGKTLRFALLPTGQDPDDLVRQGGADAFEAAIADPVPLDRLLYEAERDAADMERPEARAGLRQRLNDLAASCADRLVAEEYRRGFTSLFFEDFGWKKAERRAVASAVLRTATPGERLDLRHAYVRSMLYGLSRHPGLIGLHLEQLGAILIEEPDLRRWRDALMGAAMDHPTLDSDIIAAILEAALLPEALRHNIQQDLCFPFSVAGADPHRAAEQIGGLVEQLAGERAVDEHGAVLDAEAVAISVQGDLDGYLLVEAELAGLREQRERLRDRAAELGEPAA